MPDLKWAAELLQDSGQIWDAATLKKRRQIVHALLETVYLDAERGPVMAIRPRAKFPPLFEMTTANESAGDSLTDDVVILRPGADLADWWELSIAPG
jgi:hypothetical protein